MMLSRTLRTASLLSRNSLRLTACKANFATTSSSSGTATHNTSAAAHNTGTSAAHNTSTAAHKTSAATHNTGSAAAHNTGTAAHNTTGAAAHNAGAAAAARNTGAAAHNTGTAAHNTGAAARNTDAAAHNTGTAAHNTSNSMTNSGSTHTPSAPSATDPRVGPEGQECPQHHTRHQAYEAFSTEHDTMQRSGNRVQHNTGHHTVMPQVLIDMDTIVDGLAVLRTLHASGERLEAAHFNYVMGKKAGSVPQMIEVLQCMHELNVRPSEVTYATAVDLCGKAGFKDMVQDIVDFMAEMKIEPGEATKQLIDSYMNKLK